MNPAPPAPALASAGGLRIEPAVAGDIAAGAACVARAFAADPIAGFFFGDSPLGQAVASEAFFGFLLEARLALGLPVLVARNASGLIGLVMGKDTTDPAWPPEIDRRWQDFVAAHPGLEDRIAVHDAIVDAAEVPRPSRYLGVIGVEPGVQGSGAGAALIRAFLELADRDPACTGTSLETATPGNLPFYRHFGFEERASGAIGAATLWVLYRPSPSRPGEETAA